MELRRHKLYVVREIRQPQEGMGNVKGSVWKMYCVGIQINGILDDKSDTEENVLNRLSACNFVAMMYFR